MEMFEHLKQVKFEKQLKKLEKKLKNKKVIIYGTGSFFQTILNNYDLSNLNIIGISDMKYLPEEEGNTDLGYTIIPLEKIKDYEPDYVLIATLKYFEIMYNFDTKTFKGTKIKTAPLAAKSFWTLVKEIWSM